MASFHKEFEAHSSSSEFHLPVSWDPTHYINLAVLDVRDGKKDFSKDVSQFFARFISRSNLFSTIFGRCKKISLLKAVASRKKLPLHMPYVFAAQRLVSHFCCINRNFGWKLETTLSDHNFSYSFKLWIEYFNGIIYYFFECIMLMIILLIFEFLLPFFLSGSPAQQSSSGLTLKKVTPLFVMASTCFSLTAMSLRRISSNWWE